MSNALVKSIIDRSVTDPNATSIIYIDVHGEEVKITAGMLNQNARCFANYLSKAGIAHGDVLLISAPFCADLIYYICGAFFLGAIPAILPPELSIASRPRMVEQLKTITEKINPSGIICNACDITKLERTFKNNGSVKLLPICPSMSRMNFDNEAKLNPRIQGAAAYIQFTSGTTGFRKAAVITEEAIKTCIKSMGERFKLSENDTVINWLPLYHDLGFFGGLVLPLIWGIPAVILSPMQCMKSPELLFRLTTLHKATLTWVTNSGLHFFADHVRADRLHGVDLSSLRVVCAGGERTRLNGQKMFGDRFAPFGLDIKSLINGYGMAETTMGISVSEVGNQVVDWIDPNALQHENIAKNVEASFPNAISVLSCGEILPESSVKIINQANELLSERLIGQICLKGPSIFDHYYLDIEASKDAFLDDWFLTSDRGYIADGRLFVFGRMDDLIITSARKIQPEEIEAIADQNPLVVKGRSVAFGVYDEDKGTERIVLLCAVSNTLDESQKYKIEVELRKEIKTSLNITLDTLLVLPKKLIAKTGNNKLPRKLNKANYLSGAFHA